ncbi:Acetyltransferase (GNAT) family protein [Pseudomonas sp. NFACC02]|uniref:GNAT family N-acetyltransferase n=1 Tax=Pseudomonas sp. NFACC02 TaxID=1566250 RepID=UPI0008C761C5|nr:GNAT family N-acetyltransferase [Pseudomonas sp. NFACC02]SEP59276.1 Acetyltransferase (GNAT) family protein [Pseudomonas sp. NFACC02]
MIVKHANLRLSLATLDDLPFARELTRVNMRSYYAQYGLVWQPAAFDAEWPLRESYLICRERSLIGFLGITVEKNYLYLRDLQLIEAHRGEGVGAWAMAGIAQMAVERGCNRIRLKVFKSNPATALYRRLGYANVGEEAALLWMERFVDQR